MNNDGKGLIAFIFIPVIAIIAFLLADVFISYLENNRFKSATEDILKEVMLDDSISSDEYYEAIKYRYNKKSFNTDNLFVEVKNDIVYLENDTYFFGLLSSLKNINGKTGKIKILKNEFNVNMNSKAIIKVSAERDNDEIIFSYSK